MKLDEYDNPIFEVDDIVYSPFSPLNLGKVLSLVPILAKPRQEGRYYRIKWTKSKGGLQETVEWENHLKSLELLIADHEKKAKGHAVRLIKAQQEL
jgi:hypothetical protein